MNPTNIDNGRRVQVSTTLYSGPAGMREIAGGGEFSARGALPLGQQAIAGTVDGRRVRILGARASAFDKNMTVVTFAWDDAE